MDKKTREICYNKAALTVWRIFIDKVEGIGGTLALMSYKIFISC